MCCVVEGGFRPVRQALQDCDVLTASQSSWSGRLFITYQEPIPAMEVSGHPISHLSPYSVPLPSFVAATLLAAVLISLTGDIKR